MGAESMQLEADIKGDNPSEKTLNTFYISTEIANKLLKNKNIDQLKQNIDKSGTSKRLKIKNPIRLKIDKKISPREDVGRGAGQLRRVPQKQQ